MRRARKDPHAALLYRLEIGWGKLEVEAGEKLSLLDVIFRLGSVVDAGRPTDAQLLRALEAVAAPDEEEGW